MPLNCWSLASRLPRFHFPVPSLIGLRRTRYPLNKTQFNPRRVKLDPAYCSLHYSVSSSPVKFGSKTMEQDKFSKELEIAVRAVQMACSLCQKVQHDLITKAQDQVQSKDDNSPVTVADWSVQATVSWILCSVLGSSNVSIIAEEDVQSLSKTRAAGLLESVVQTVNECLSEASRFGFQPPESPLDALQVLDSISHCTSTRSPRSSTFWALDPRGSGEAWMQPLVQDQKSLVWPNFAKRVRVSTVDNPELATFCEPVEKANSSHSFTAGLAQSVGLRKEPLRVYSMVKYATIARGHAEVFMKFARTGYKEKIWDHAAGVVIVQEAGGVVTDAGGRPLDFSGGGAYLEGLDRGIIASSGAELHGKIIEAVDASWNSSSL
ncbi:PAP-specific phosphatase HAL2-like [Linum perenne]